MWTLMLSIHVWFTSQQWLFTIYNLVSQLQSSPAGEPVFNTIAASPEKRSGRKKLPL
jgi:hypothetical protein